MRERACTEPTSPQSGSVDWLKRLRAVCTERNIVLIFDEVFVGFRLAPGGAQEHFGVNADMVGATVSDPQV